MQGEEQSGGNPLLKGLGGEIGGFVPAGEFRWKDLHNPQTWLYGCFFLAGLSWIVRLFLLSDGAVNQDEIAHLLLAKNAWYHPSFLLDEWGKFVNNLFYFIPSLFGLTGARVFSIIISCVTVVLTTQVARIFDIKYYFLIPLFLWFQPFFGGFAFSTLTEIPFSLIMLLTVLLTLKDKHGAASFLVGLLPLARHEAILLTGLWCLYYLYLKKVRYILFAVTPLLLYILLYFLVKDEFVYRIFFEPRPTTHYGLGGEWSHFFGNLPTWMGPAILVLVVLGLWEIRKHGMKAIVFLSGYLLYYLAHIVIWKFGLYSSGGYYIVLIPVAPAFAILAALGIKGIMQKINGIIQSRAYCRALKMTVFLIVIPLVVVHGLKMGPYEAEEEQLLMKQVAQNIENLQERPTKVVSTHVWFYYYYFYDRPWTYEEQWISPPKPTEMPPGTIVVWDAHFSDRFGLSLADLMDPTNNFEKIMASRSGKVIVFYKG